MALLLLKLTLTPILIAGASLAARRWGPAVGGWLVALPLTSAPIALYLALDKGDAFAAGAATGSAAGLVGDAVFALAYAVVAERRGWPSALVAGTGAFALSGLAVQPLLGGSIAVLLVVVIVAMAIVYALTPTSRDEGALVTPPRWDIPARAAVGTLLVLAITGAASGLGALLSGVVATFPVYVSVMTVFAHRLGSTGAAIGILRGLQLGLFGTAAGLATLAATLVPLGVGPAFAASIAVLAVVHGTILVLRPAVARKVPARD